MRQDNKDSYGNTYSDHAIASMQPSGHRYSNGSVIHYTDSRGNDCDGSSITAMSVDNALKNATPTTDYRDGKECKVYVRDGVKVVTDAKTGVIITTTKV